MAAAQRPNGSWPCAALYTDGIDYYGSEELTTGLCVAVLRQRPA
jgi:hypothetical protein